MGGIFEVFDYLKTGLMAKYLPKDHLNNFIPAKMWRMFLFWPAFTGDPFIDFISFSKVFSLAEAMGDQNYLVLKQMAYRDIVLDVNIVRNR